jgi:hypothetical protein
MICWWTNAPNSFQMRSTIAWRLLACQQYQAALPVMACLIAISTKPR